MTSKRHSPSAQKKEAATISRKSRMRKHWGKKVALGEPPSDLGAHGREMWADVRPKLESADLDRVPFGWALEQMCRLWDRLRDGGDFSAQHHQVLQRCFIEFGLTPAAWRRLDRSPRATQRRAAQQIAAARGTPLAERPANRFTEFKPPS